MVASLRRLEPCAVFSPPAPWLGTSSMILGLPREDLQAGMNAACRPARAVTDSSGIRVPIGEESAHLLLHRGAILVANRNRARSLWKRSSSFLAGRPGVDPEIADLPLFPPFGIDALDCLPSRRRRDLPLLFMTVSGFTPAADSKAVNLRSARPLGRGVPGGSRCQAVSRRRRCS